MQVELAMSWRIGIGILRFSPSTTVLPTITLILNVLKGGKIALGHKISVLSKVLKTIRILRTATLIVLAFWSLLACRLNPSHPHVSDVYWL
jgi:hypothetical protein